jgi:hypothetical protein
LITTEIPDPETDPLGYILVSEHMIHGPCGEQNPTAPCMKNGRCSKIYPNFSKKLHSIIMVLWFIDVEIMEGL